MVGGAALLNSQLTGAYVEVVMDHRCVVLIKKIVYRNPPKEILL